MKIVNKKRFVLTMTIFASIIISIFNLVIANVEEPVVVEEHTVIKGETLWSIALEYTTGDIREYIYRLRELNNLDDCNLKIGQDILIIK